jgi:hypothetical protein
MRNTPDLIAKVHLLPTSQGGRAGPTRADKHHCIMIVGDHNLDVRLELDQIGSLRPGQEAVVPIRFADPEFAKKFVNEGTTFKLREVGIIGEGVVQELRLIR